MAVRTYGNQNERQRRRVNLTSALLVAVAATAFGAVFAPMASPRLAEESAASDESLTPLPRLSVRLDGKPTPLGLAYADGDCVLVPLASALPALSHGVLRLVPPKPGDMSASVTDAAGKPVATLPIAGANAGGGTAAPATIGREPFPLQNGATWGMADGKPALMMDLQTLAGLFGITVDRQSSEAYLYSPGYWAGRVGVPDTVATPAALEAALALRPELGISPPAQTVMVWVRPPAKAGDLFVQIYALPTERVDGLPVDAAKARTPRPLLGISNTGDPITFPEPGFGTPESRTASQTAPVRVDAEFYPESADEKKTWGAKNAKNAQYAPYVAVLTTKPPKDGDALGAIRSGDIGAGEWAIVGIRQRIGRAFVQYDLRGAKEGETLSGLAATLRLPLPMLLSLNGFTAADANRPLAPGEKIVYLRDFDAKTAATLQADFLAETGVIAQNAPVPVPQTKPETKPAPVPDYRVEVEVGEDLADVAQKTGIPADTIADANGLPPGADVEAGETVVVPASLRVPKVKPFPPSQFIGAPAVLKRAGRVFAGSDFVTEKATLPKGTAVLETRRYPSITKSEINYKAGGKGRSGWIPTGFLEPPPVEPAPQTGGGGNGGGGNAAPPPPPGQLPQGYTPEMTRVVQEAVRWIGRPRYVWGGNNISSGIDCSHYVAAVYNRAGVPVPSPPVHFMEDRGSIVDWKGGVAEEGGAMRQFPPNNAPFSRLSPGDRVIFQCRPAQGQGGSHHTGIYLGRYGNLAHAVIHCNSSHNTVSVDDLGGRYLNGIYRYCVRGTRARKPGTWLADGSPAPAKVSAKPEVAR